MPRKPTDPIFAAIAIHGAAHDVFSAEAAFLAPRRRSAKYAAEWEVARTADEAGEAASDARNALSTILPTTPAGFCALIRFHAADVQHFEPETYGALALRDIAAALNALARASPA